MNKKVKLSKRQIKEDKFATFMLTSKQYATDNWQFIIIGLAILILIVSSIVYYTNSLQKQSLEVSTQFARATSEYRSGNIQVAKLSFSQILDDFGNSDFAGKATFMLGKLNLESKNYVEATKYFESYLAKFKKDKLHRISSLAGLGTILENQGQNQQAADKFVAAYDEYPESPLSGDYLNRALMNFMQSGNDEKAKEILSRIENKFPGTDLLSKAQIAYREKGLK
ncbi:MAG: tetratricopeptide repeat protein [candidate division Zixibacteria bacterium]|nr:tetratricopeptide repeat protein [candidate division Zixibacteria bacterium]